MTEKLSKAEAAVVAGGNQATSVRELKDRVGELEEELSKCERRAGDAQQAIAEYKSAVKSAEAEAKARCAHT